MGESFLFSMNAVLPVFLLAALGYVFRKTGVLGDPFFSGANKLMFRISLPVSLYLDILSCGSFSLSDGGAVLFVVSGILVLFFLLLLTVPLFVKGNRQRGAFIQGVYRTNIAILCLPLMKNMFGDDGGKVMALILPFSILLFNALAVVVLSLFAPEEKKKTKKELAVSILKSIVTNPLIIGIVLGLFSAAIGLQLPAFAEKTLNYVGDLTVPLALIALGGRFSVKTMKSDMPLLISAVLLRCFLVPAAAVGAGILCGFRGLELGAIFVVFGSPTAVSSYVMAESMGSDYDLAGNILLSTTVVSAFSLFLGIFFLRYFRLI